MSSPDKLKIKAALKIQRPVDEVFEGIVDPEKMRNYFISQSTGRMAEGKTLTWRFPEFDMEFPVHIGKVEKDKYISFSWTDPEGNETKVEINLQQMNDGTFVKITEGEREHNAAGIEWLGRNTEGWANFLACLKAYLEYGVNLRKGAFDISQMPTETTT